MADGQDNLTVKFEGESGGVKVIKSFTFERGHYGIKVSHEVVNNTASEIKPSVYYQLTRDGEKPEGESTMVNAYTGAAVTPIRISSRRSVSLTLPTGIKISRQKQITAGLP